MRFTHAFRRPEPVPVLFTLLAVAVTLSLGVWQLKRLEWKEGLIAKIEAGQALPPLERLPNEAAALEALAFRRVALTGHFLYDKSFYRAGGYPGIGSGYFLMTPFKDAGGAVILVNRGFSAGEKHEVEARETARPAEALSLSGILRPAREKRLFTPANQPERNLWFYEDTQQMRALSGLSLAPLVVEATGKRVSGEYPIPHSGEITLRNDHLGYAVTWFALALAAVVMFGAYYYKWPEKHS